MMCEHCWREAQLRHANGQGEGESVTEVYHRLIDENWCKPLRADVVPSSLTRPEAGGERDG